MTDNQNKESNKHLTYFKVENFKGFDSFEMEDIGQFNIIVGDNNVGKTSVLEALCFDEDLESFIRHLLTILASKGLKASSNALSWFFSLGQPKEIKITYSFNSTEDSLIFSIKARNKLEKEIQDAIEIRKRNLHFSDNHTIGSTFAVLESKEGVEGLDLTNIDLPSLSLVNTPFIPTTIYLEESDVISFFSRYVQASKSSKKHLIHDLKVFLPEIENIEISTDTVTDTSIFIVFIRNIDAALPLRMHGDGAIKLFRILVEIAVEKDGRLMIDEIDDGIHYSRFKSFWKTILKAAKRNNVQLFATTHNMECLKYLKLVLEEEDMEEFQPLIRNYTLVKSPEGKVKAFKYKFEDFEYALNQGVEIR